MSSKTLRLVAYGLLTAASVPLLLFGASLLGLLPWSPVNCWHRDIDIQSGRIRFTRYLFWMPIDQRIEDSSLTKALRGSDTAETAPEWRRVLTFSPGLRHSPHYRYHSAIAQVRELEMALSLATFTSETRRPSARRVLRLWQESGEDRGARDYLRAVAELALATTNQVDVITEDRLPQF